MYVDRYIQVLGVKNSKVTELCKSFIRFSLLKSDLTLKTKPSVIASSCLTLALNIISSEKISKQINLEQVVLQKFEDSPINVWSNESLKNLKINEKLTKI